jgi:flagellar biosynthesis component FlhA
MQGPPNYSPRIGTFLILLGSGFFCLFVLMAIGRQFQIIYILLAAALIFIGIRMRRQSAPSPSSGRFGIINKSREQMKKRKDAAEKRRKEKEEKKKKK